MIIEVNNRQSLLRVDNPRIKCELAQLLAHEGFDEGEVSVAIVDDKEIHKLNRLHLKHDYPTDVLSFVLERNGSFLNGEVIASAQMAISRCHEFAWPADCELALYLFHGALHLAGYNDKQVDEQAEMRRCEQHYLKRFGWIRGDSDMTITNRDD